MTENLEEKIEKLITYGKTQLKNKNVETQANTLRNVLDDITKISVGGNDTDSIELNIHYGDTEPSDISKLWLETEEPINIEIDNSIFGNGIINNSYSTLSKTLTKPANASIVKYGDYFYIFDTVDIYKYDYKNDILQKLDITLNGTHWYYSDMYGVSTCLVKDVIINDENVGDRIYIFGGTYYDSPNGKYVYGRNISYIDLNTETLVANIGTLSMDISDTAMVAYNGKIYMIGNGSHTYYRKYIVVFNPSDNTTTNISFSSDLNGVIKPSVIILDDTIYCFGGGSDYYQIFSYNITNNTFDTSYTNPNNYYFNGIHNACVFNNDIYIYDSAKLYKFNIITREIELLTTEFLTGSSTQICLDEENQRLIIFLNGSNIMTYTISQPLQENYLHIVTNLSNNFVKIINTESIKLNIGISSVYKGDSQNNAQKIESKIYNTETNEWESI